jgi:hypothetical protein
VLALAAEGQDGPRFHQRVSVATESAILAPSLGGRNCSARRLPV